MPRVLVVLPTSSYRTADFVTAAARLGVDLAVASEQEPPLGVKLAGGGDAFVRIDCTQPDLAGAAIVDLADRTPIDAIVAADDAGVVTAAIASERLGLPHHSPEAAALTRDKLELRRRLAAAEIPQPRFVALGEDDDPVATADALSYPIVVKPRTGSGSRGVLRADDPDELAVAVGRVRQVATDMGEKGPLVMERFVDGAEAALEAMVVEGRLVPLALFDKPDTSPGPTFEETLLVTPSSLPTETANDIERVVAATVDALGLTHGPVHAEVRIDPHGKVHLLEIAARSIGGLCGRSLRFGLMGASLEELILGAALGREFPHARQPRPAGVMMVPVERSGVLVAVEGVSEVRALGGITEVEITIPIGTRVDRLPEGDRYLGFLLATAATTGEVADLLRAASAMLRVTIVAG